MSDIDKIRESAIEAATKQAIITAITLAGGDVAGFGVKWDDEKQEDKDKILTCARVAIQAYEAAMWVPVSRTDMSSGKWIVDEARDPYFCRPLPTPPEKKT